MEFKVSLDRFNEFAERFWKAVKDAKVFAFHGEMGAGKTTIISSLCHYKGTADVTGSPTFSIINEYQLDDGQKVYHIDLYRLKDEEEVIQAGVEDCVFSGAICMIEWPEKAPHLFDENSIHVFIEPVSEKERKVTIGQP
jgi:tRNA threonylcarbamoyladenosine biosynthesis protein TsaE